MANIRTVIVLFSLVSKLVVLVTGTTPLVSTKSNFTLYIYKSGISIFTPSLNLRAEVLIVGGGGGGGASTCCEGGGGGGAGSVGYGVLNLKQGMPYKITVGTGGVAGSNGGASTISGIGLNEIGNGGGSGGSCSDYGGPDGSGGGGNGAYSRSNTGGKALTQTVKKNLTYLGTSGGSGAHYSIGGGGGGAQQGGADSGDGGGGFIWDVTHAEYGGGGGGGFGNQCCTNIAYVRRLQDSSGNGNGDGSGNGNGDGSSNDGNSENSNDGEVQLGGGHSFDLSQTLSVFIPVDGSPGGGGGGGKGGSRYLSGSDGSDNTGGGGGGSGCSGKGGGKGGDGVVIIAFSCPGGYRDDLNGTSACTICPIGTYSPEPIEEEKYYNADKQFSVCTECPAGKYSSSPGSSSCNDCPPGTFGNATRLSSCSTCPLGKFSYPATTLCLPCAANHFSSKTGGPDVCQLCEAGKYSNPGSTICKTCPSGYYSINGSDCQWCGAQYDHTLKFNNKTYHWTGGPTKQQCYCEKGYTMSSLCTVKECGKAFDIPSLSLGSLLLNSDMQLRIFTASLGNIAELPSPLVTLNQHDQLNSAYDYLYKLISVGLDINGDGNITRAEIESALNVRSVSVANASFFPVWCIRPVAGSLCYQLEVEVKQMYNDALSNFKNSSKHYFDGSGVPVIVDLESSYPTPAWSVATCKSFDQSISPDDYKPVNTSWTFQSRYDLSVESFCAYDISTGEVKLSSDSPHNGYENTSAFFLDHSRVYEINSYKRIYCIKVIYLQKSSNIISTGVECTVGLLFVSFAHLSV